MAFALKQEYLNVHPFTEKEWEEIEKRYIKKRVKKGELLVREGDPYNQVTFVNSGIFVSYITQDIDKKIRGFFPENTFITDHRGFITYRPAICTVEAIEDSEILQITHHEIQELYSLGISYERFGRIIAERICDSLFEQLNNKYLLSPEQQYKSLLRDNPGLLNRVPLYMIASYLGITPEALSRIRKRIKKNHLDLLTPVNRQAKPQMVF